MKLDGHLIVANDKKAEAIKVISERLKELGLDYEITEKSVQFTVLTATLKLSKLKMLKHLFTLVKAPENEIQYLVKAKSIVEATARDILTQVLQSIKG